MSSIIDSGFFQMLSIIDSTFDKYTGRGSSTESTLVVVIFLKRFFTSRFSHRVHSTSKSIHYDSAFNPINGQLISHIKRYKSSAINIFFPLHFRYHTRAAYTLNRIFNIKLNWNVIFQHCIDDLFKYTHMSLEIAITAVTMFWFYSPYLAAHFLFIFF